VGTFTKPLVKCKFEHLESMLMGWWCYPFLISFPHLSHEGGSPSCSCKRV
jgi:hypothetical protein